MKSVSSRRSWKEAARSKMDTMTDTKKADAAIQYVEADYNLYRLLNGRMGAVEVYRGNGRWETPNPTGLAKAHHYGLAMSEDDAIKYMAEIDKD